MPQPALSQKEAPAVGQIVNVRSRRFVVSDVAASSVGAGARSRTTLVTLSSVEDDAHGEELRVVWEIEPGAAVMERASMPDVEGFDDPGRLDAFLNAVRWGAVSQADVSALQSTRLPSSDWQTTTPLSGDGGAGFTAGPRMNSPRHPSSTQI